MVGVMKWIGLPVGAALLAGGLGMAPPARAAGCNGVVNIFVWGCAPWDNNNGPQHAYYRKKVVTLPAQGTQIVEKNGVKFALRNGQYFPLVSPGGGSIVSDHGGALVSDNGGGFRVWSQ